jgi:hypothetical protein
LVNRFSSTPIEVTSSRRSVSSILGSVCSTTALFAHVHPTPKLAAACAIEHPSMFTMSEIRLRARTVSDAREAIRVEVSNQVLRPQSGSGQRHRRFAHTNTTG